MSLLGLLTEVLARPAPAKRAASLMDALLWRGLLGLAILFLLLAFWRVLEASVGPILAPLIMAAALAMAACILAFTEARRRKRIKDETPALAPLIATVLEIAFAPKLVRWIALGNLLYETFITGTGPLAKGKATPRGRR